MNAAGARCLLRRRHALSRGARQVVVARGMGSSSTQCAPSPRPMVVVVTGPTAVGKSAVGLELAQALGGEIISADSVQVFQGLDVGAAKLPVGERRGIPHHLIDLLPPTAEFSAGDFYRAARSAVADIVKRGKIPVVVGGTGFYLRWFIHGKPETPKSTPSTAKAVQQMMDEAWFRAAVRQSNPLTEDEKWDIAVALVESYGDQEAANRLRLERNNYYRLQRMLQILIQRPGQQISQMDIVKKDHMDFDFRCFFLCRPRLELFHRIMQRCEEMVAGGLLREAQALLDLDLNPGSNMATKSIGYRQTMQLLQDCERNKRDLSREMGATEFKWLDATQPTAEIIGQIFDSLDKEWHEEQDSGEVPLIVYFNVESGENASGENHELSEAEAKALKHYVPQLTTPFANDKALLQNPIDCWNKLHSKSAKAQT